jgi:tRNA-specific 2-thiouridylase
MIGRKEKAVIAMSGGVDSSAAAALMIQEGYDCIGVTLKLYTTEESGGDGAGTGGEAKAHRGCCSLADVNDARQVAHKLGMPHYVLNFTEAFRKEVIGRFIETYEKGGTPNPCIDCNRFIKFDLLLFRANQLDFDLLVTGHYAQVEKDPVSGRYLLKKSVDAKKDQSYVLYCLTQEQLARTRFPLGGLTKPEVRELAEAKGFINANKQDSQDICFVPDGDYGAFMERYTGKEYPEGDIVDLEGRIVGRHRGIVRYTLGQRRGLGVAMNDPVYVAAKDMARNTVTLGPEASLYTKALTATNINLIACERIDSPLRVRVKTRYLQQERPAAVEQTSPDEIRVTFDEPQRAVTPGQAAVLYDGGIVVGGGTIISTR